MKSDELRNDFNYLVKSHLIPYFNTQKKIIELFYSYLTQKEEWFEANILLLFKELENVNIIRNFQIEKENIDLYLELNDMKIYCELKHWIGKVRNNKIEKGKQNPYKLSSYFSKGKDKPNVFYWKDIIKLKNKSKEINTKCYLLIIYQKYEKETVDEINKSIDNFKSFMKEKDVIIASEKYDQSKNGYMMILLEVSSV